jgi:hypothetical protein
MFTLDVFANRGLRSVLLAGASALALGGFASTATAADDAVTAGKNAAALQARRAELLKELEAIDAELVTEGVTVDNRFETEGATVDNRFVTKGVTVLPAATTPRQGRALTASIDLFGGLAKLHGDEANDFSTGEFNIGGIIGGDARIDYPIDDNLGVQLDLHGDARILSSGSDSTSAEHNYVGNVTLGAHANYREHDQYLIGAFLAGGQGFVDDTGSSDARPGRYIVVGGEGQMYFDNLTVYGQAGYIDSWQAAENNPDTLHNGWFVRGVGRYYMNQGQTMVALEGSFASGDMDSTDEVDVIGWGVALEHQFRTWATDDAFVTGFLRYNGTHFNETSSSPDDTFYDHSILVGAKFAFNVMDLLDMERRGIAVDLPNVGMWVVNAGQVD